MRVTVCFCHFCQRATGSQGMVEPIFERAHLAVIRGTPKVYSRASEGSGQMVHVHFCDTCGTKTHLTFDRWPDIAGIYAGTFDDPNWFALDPSATKFIYLSSAARGTLVPPGYPTFQEHAATPSGEPIEPEVLSKVLHVT